MSKYEKACTVFPKLAALPVTNSFLITSPRTDTTNLSAHSRPLQARNSPCHVQPRPPQFRCPIYWKRKCPAPRPGALYWGVTLKWDYYKARTVDLSMPGYVAKALARFEHSPKGGPQHAPSAWSKPLYSSAPQLAKAEDTSAKLDNAEIT
jgi:hypothetical protein